MWLPLQSGFRSLGGQGAGEDEMDNLTLVHIAIYLGLRYGIV